MVLRSSLAAAAVMTLAGCAQMPGPGSSLESFTHRVATSEIVLLWNCLQSEPRLLSLEGVAWSPWQAQPVQFLEFELVGVDAKDRMAAQKAGAARDLQLHTNQMTPFTLELKTTGTEVRFDLYYRYQFRQFFEGRAVDARLAGPLVPRHSSSLLAQTISYLVRDACSDSEHRAY